MTPEPNIITDWINISGLGLYKPGTRGKESGRRYCEGVAAAINRHPDRRAEVKNHKTLPRCRVVDYSRPIKQRKHHNSHVDYGLIIGWETMEGY